jgi:hypothetical protein
VIQLPRERHKVPRALMRVRLALIVLALSAGVALARATAIIVSRLENSTPRTTAFEHRDRAASRGARRRAVLPLGQQ